MTLTEIQNNYAKEQGYESWLNLLFMSSRLKFNYHWKAVFILVQQEQQKLIVENARIIIDDVTDWHTIDKSSIINENNIIR